jgi:hypothetical protein
MSVKDMDEETLEAYFVYYSMLRTLKENATHASCKEEIRTICNQFRKLRKDLISRDSDFELIPYVSMKADEAYLLRQVLVALDQAITLLGILVIPEITKSERYIRISEDLGMIQSGQPFGRLSAFLTVLGLTNNWAIAASALCLLEVLVNHRLEALRSTTKGNFEERVKRLNSAAKRKGMTIPNLLAPAFYDVRHKVIHGGKEPTSKEVDIILDFLSNLFKETAKI